MISQKEEQDSSESNVGSVRKTQRDVESRREREHLFCRENPFWVVTPQERDWETCQCKTPESLQFTMDKMHKLGLSQSSNLEEIADSTVCNNSKAQAKNVNTPPLHRNPMKRWSGGLTKVDNWPWSTMWKTKDAMSFDEEVRDSGTQIELYYVSEEEVESKAQKIYGVTIKGTIRMHQVLSNHAWHLKIQRHKSSLPCSAKHVGLPMSWTPRNHFPDSVTLPTGVHCEPRWTTIPWGYTGGQRT